jgi:hypothetical protein
MHSQAETTKLVWGTEKNAMQNTVLSVEYKSSGMKMIHETVMHSYIQIVAKKKSTYYHQIEH